MTIVRTFFGLRPGSTPSNCAALLIMSPAAESTTSASATSHATERVAPSTARGPQSIRGHPLLMDR